MQPPTTRLLPLTLVLAVAGCNFGGPPPLPADLVPLDEVNEAPLPEPAGGSRHPEAFNTVGDRTIDFDQAHGRGYIHQPLRRVWTAVQDPDVFVDRRRVSEWRVQVNEDSAWAANWRTKVIVRDIMTVEFETEWRLDTSGGTPADPGAVAGRGAKVAGTSFISLLEDSIVLLPVDDDVTQIELIRHSKTFNTGPEENEQFIQDLYETIKERAHGRAYPVFN